MIRLCERITAATLWPALEQAAIQIVTAGGMAAMGYYRDAWSRSAAVGEDRKNPSTDADIQATAAILQSCHTILSPMAGELVCGVSYLGEESQYDGLLRGKLSDDVMRHKHDPARFFESSNNVLRVIFDGIDGTANFNRGLPFFCSAVAVLIDDQVRVSAIYDPIHHLVYSAALTGPYETPTGAATASAWPVASGSKIDLIAGARSQPPTPLNREAVGTHFTRTRPKALQGFLRPSPGQSEGQLERLVAGTGGVYALNSGLVAMAEVARGALGAFVNVVTNPWDVAAGECLVRACGGIVTTISGAPIEYVSADPVSVLAAKQHLHGPLLQLLAG